MSEYDLIIRGGSIYDGTGGAPFQSDVAIIGKRIVAVEPEIAGHGIDEIAARGQIVTPGFVDIHTHYDGQATWEKRMVPSSNHGVTTVVAGNCGVGFAPCRKGDRDELIRLMEGVEDIPEIVMSNGIPWNWESFPSYLEALSDRQLDVDIAVHVPHSALRVFVMGKRGADREPANAAEIAQMRALVDEAVRAGAIGVSTSRMLNHRTKAGEQAPSIHAAEIELQGLAGGLRDAGGGVFQLIPDVDGDPDYEFDLMERLVEKSGRPLSFSLVQTPANPKYWETYLRRLQQRKADDTAIRAQVFPRPVGILQGLGLSFNPFSLHPSFKKIAALPHAEKVKAMRDPAFRQQLLTEQPTGNNAFEHMLIHGLQNMFMLGDPPNYTPPLEQKLSARAARQGVTMHELAYDMLLEEDGHAILYWPGANFSDGNLDAARAMMMDHHSVVGLGDGGAHYGLICDSSFPTFMLSWWAREAPEGQRIALPRMVRELTRKPAEALGLTDRGIIAVGAKADVNVIDYDALKLYAPRPIFDLPAGGRRLMQKADGYSSTIVSGEITYRNGEATQALPGRLQKAM